MNDADRPVAVRGLHHFAWRCRDSEETRHFYEDLLGLPLVHVIKSDHVPSTGEYCPYVHIFFQMRDGSYMAFFDLGDDIASEPSPNTPAWVNHIALRVDTPAELRAAKARLEAAGIEVLGVTDHHIIESIYFFDPNGFRVELTTPTVSSAEMDRHAAIAHHELATWTQRKAGLRSERATSLAGERRVTAGLQLAVIDVKPGAALESQSGLQMLRPRIYGAWRAPAGARTAAIVMHPTSNFMGHYLIEPLAARGIACMGLNSRYMGNDTVLLMERAIQDLGAGVKYLRAQGYERVLLIGNSGGAALASFYQAQAERLTATRFADGDPTHLHPDDLPPVDGIALCAAHLGRSRLLLDWIDPSVTDEHDPLSVDPSLDMYDARHGQPYDAAFLTRFQGAQRARRDRIEQWALARLEQLRATPGAPRDQAFVVYRTHADPRCVDLSLDANDRAPGSVWGDARQVNYSANAMGRTTSLTAFLSQWSSRSQADGPTNLARTSVPVLLLTYTGDQSTFPSTRDAWLAAGGERIRNVDIVGGNHYLAGQPALVAEAAEQIAAWAHTV